MTDAAVSPAPAKVPGKASPFNELEVLWVRHWTDSLFSFGVKRPEDFRFRSGEFVMIGLPGEDGGKPVLRAYSIASPCWAEELEFFSIKVADGPLTSRLQKIQPGDTVLMGKKPTGTLVLDALTGGERLFLIGTGTGLAPWLSVARDPRDLFPLRPCLCDPHGPQRRRPRLPRLLHPRDPRRPPDWGRGAGRN